MSYVERYNFDFFSARDLRSPLACDEYEVKIFERDGVTATEEISAQESPVIISYTNSSDNKLLPLRGSECVLNLIATVDFQLEDLYTEDERYWLVQVSRNASLIWQGFIIPDGCQESWMFTPYTIQVNATDGLGLLKNLSFVQNSGDFYIGKLSFMEVIYACLVRLGLPELKINTCVNIYPDGETQGDALDPLALTFVDAQRFLKDDEFTPMNCQEVLESVLQEWTACIIQSEGEYYIYRPNEAALSNILVFRNYTDGVYTGTTSKDLSIVIGGYSEGVVFAPYYHVLTDQLKMIERPYKNASMSYKYGVKQNPDEQLDNPDLSGAGQGCGGDPVGPCDDVTIPGWTKTGTMYAGLWPTGGVIFYSDGGTYPTLTNYYENDNLIPIDNGKRLKIVIDYENPAYINGTDMNFVISLTDGSTVWYLQADGSWAITAVEPGLNYYSLRSDTTNSATIISNVVPSGGNITFRILAPSGTVEDIIYKNISAFVILELGSIVGEIHTATQDGVFTYVPDTINVFNGDSEDSIYIGAIFKSDETTLTDLWVRRGLSESLLAEPYETSKPFLRIAVEEIQRLYAQPFVKFEGSVGNYFNPLSIIRINDLTGVFMPVSLVYDLQENICKSVQTRISNDEIAMDYTLVPDYGQTTKVTVI
jgi:hypothetical protein